MALFFDQLYVHTCPRVLAKMEELGFKYVKNAAYSPQYNQIELVFSKVKRYYRQARINGIINDNQTQIRTQIRRAFSEVTLQDCRNCIQKAVSLI